MTIVNFDYHGGGTPDDVLLVKTESWQASPNPSGYSVTSDGNGVYKTSNISTTSLHGIYKVILRNSSDQYLDHGYTELSNFDANFIVSKDANQLNQSYTGGEISVTGILGPKYKYANIYSGDSAINCNLGSHGVSSTIDIKDLYTSTDVAFKLQRGKIFANIGRLVLETGQIILQSSINVAGTGYFDLNCNQCVGGYLINGINSALNRKYVAKFSIKQASLDGYCYDTLDSGSTVSIINSNIDFDPLIECNILSGKHFIINSYIKHPNIILSDEATLTVFNSVIDGDFYIESSSSVKLINSYITGNITGSGTIERLKVPTDVFDILTSEIFYAKINQYK